MEAKEQLDSAIEQSCRCDHRRPEMRCRDCAIPHSRATISHSRSAHSEKNSQMTRPIDRPAFRVAVEGEPRNLHPILRDEIYKIAAEALRNAFSTPRHGRSRLKSAMTKSNSDCVYGMTEKESIRRFSRSREVRGTMAYTGCRNAPN